MLRWTYGEQKRTNVRAKIVWAQWLMWHTKRNVIALICIFRSQFFIPTSRSFCRGLILAFFYFYCSVLAKFGLGKICLFLSATFFSLNPWKESSDRTRRVTEGNDLLSSISGWGWLPSCFPDICVVTTSQPSRDRYKNAKLIVPPPFVAALLPLNSPQGRPKWPWN